MKFRLLPAFLLLGLASVISGHATPPTVTWHTSGGTDGNVTTGSNWIGEVAPGAGYNVSFGNTPHPNLVIPGSTIPLNNLTFTGGSRPDYTISGTGEALLYLQGSITNNSGANLTINNSVLVGLSDTTHTVSIASGTTVTVAANVDADGNGRIDKTGAGTLQLSGENSFGLTSNNGTVTLQSSAARGNRDWTFSDVGFSSANTAILRIEAANGISGSSATYFNSDDPQSSNSESRLVAAVQNSVTGGALVFNGTSSLQATAGGVSAGGAGVISGGYQYFYDNSLLKAGVTNSISGGEQTFNGNAILTASGASAITGGYQYFYSEGDEDLTRLVVNQNGSIAGGEQYFYGFSSLQANNQSGGSIIGGRQFFSNDAYLRASYANAVSGGEQTFAGHSHLDANVTGAVGAAEITLQDHSAIQVGATNALSSSTEIYFDGSNGGQGGSLILNGFNTAIGEINSGGGLGNPQAGFIQNDGLAAAILTVGNSESSTFDGLIRDRSGLSEGTLALTKVGTGTLELTNANTYTGGTTLSEGTLVAGNNTALGNSTVPITFNGGTLRVTSGVTLNNPIVFNNTVATATLSGSGTFGSAVTAGHNVILSPGNSPGTLGFSAGLTLASGSAIHFQVRDADGAAGVGYDLINVSGGLLSLTAESNTITFNLVSLNSDGFYGDASNFNPANSYSWTFAVSDCAISGFHPDQFHFVNGFTNDLAGGSFSFAESPDQRSLLLNFTPVPEPSTWMLLGTGAAVLFVSSRRRLRRPRMQCRPSR